MFGGKEDYLLLGYGNWVVKGFSCKINECFIYVVGLFYLSCYFFVGKIEVIKWLLSKI